MKTSGMKHIHVPPFAEQGVETGDARGGVEKGHVGRSVVGRRGGVDAELLAAFEHRLVGLDQLYLLAVVLPANERLQLQLFGPAVLAQLFGREHNVLADVADLG